MSLERQLKEIQYKELLKRAHFGDEEARKDFIEEVEKLKDVGDIQSVADLEYLALRVYIELLEEYIDALEKEKT